MKDVAITIQQGGAPPHTGSNNVAKLNTEGAKGGLIVLFVTQPAQSLDINVVELSFFNSLKSQISKVKLHVRNPDTFTEKVPTTCKAYDRTTLHHIWGHLFACWN